MTATVLLAAGLVPAALVAPASAAASPAARFVAGVNAARAEHHLPPLRVAADVTAVAADWVRRMATAHDIAHNPQLRSAVHGWRALGENVGMGPDVASIADAFLGSPAHRANILDRGYTEIGVATAVGSDGTLYVVEDFRRPTGARPTPAAPRTPQAPPAPHAAPRLTARTPAAHRTVDPRPTDTVAAPAARAPRPAATPADRLRDRLRAVRARATRGGATDPLAAAEGFADAMAALAAPPAG